MSMLYAKLFAFRALLPRAKTFAVHYGLLLVSVSRLTRVSGLQLVVIPCARQFKCAVPKVF